MSVGRDSGNSTGNSVEGSVNSVDSEKAVVSDGGGGRNHGSTPQPPQQPPPRPQRQSIQARHVAASVPSPSPEAAECVGSLGDDDLDIEAPETPKQGRAPQHNFASHSRSRSLVWLSSPRPPVVES